MRRNNRPSEPDFPAPTWPTDWMRAALGLCALRALESGPSYGYAILMELEAAGLGAVKGGTLYPLLTRYEAAGWVVTAWHAGTAGPGRKYFSLTDIGHAELDGQRSAWERFTATTLKHLREDTPPPPEREQPHAPSRTGKRAVT